MSLSEGSGEEGGQRKASRPSWLTKEGTRFRNKSYELQISDLGWLSNFTSFQTGRVCFDLFDFLKIFLQFSYSLSISAH